MKWATLLIALALPAAAATTFKVTLLTGGCRAVDLKPGDGDKAIAEMRARGVTIA